MKKKVQLLFMMIALYLILIPTVQGQWSILENDPRYDEKESYLFQKFTQAEWQKSNFATAEQMAWFTDARYGMFVHFGLNSFVHKDMSWPIVYTRKMPDHGHGSYPDSAWQVEWPSKFKLEKFNAREWVDIAKRSGMKYMIIIAKHHDGFHMWDTDFSAFKITNTPFGRDYLKELIDACHEVQLPVGIYYSQRDWYHPDYEPIDPHTAQFISNPPYYEALPGKQVMAGKKHKKYIEYQFNAVRELLTKYGKIDIFWFDAVYWGGMFTADMWDSERLTRMIRELQPGIVINNRTSLPGDFDTPEQRIGMYQSRPWESAMTLNGSWGFDPSHKIKTTSMLIQEMLIAAAGNGNVLMSWGAKFDGEYDHNQKDTLLKIGDWLNQNGTYYYGTKGGPWMPSKNYGAVYKGNQVFIYLFDSFEDGLKLPKLAKSKLKQVRYVSNGKPISWKIQGDRYLLNALSKKDPIVEIIALEFDSPIQEILVEKSYSIFDSPSYGKLIKEVSLGPETLTKNGFYIDLTQVREVTGVGIYGQTKDLEIQISKDGQKWEKIPVKGSGDKQEVSLNTFMTGVQVPGKPIQYMRIQALSNEKLAMKIYAK